MIDAGPSNLLVKIQKVLSDSPIWDLRQIRVEHIGDSLYLHGRVKTYYHKQLAQEIILRSSREISVVNQIDVVG